MGVWGSEMGCGESSILSTVQYCCQWREPYRKLWNTVAREKHSDRVSLTTRYV